MIKEEFPESPEKRTAAASSGVGDSKDAYLGLFHLRICLFLSCCMLFYWDARPSG